jgi:glucose-6-phosphate isomerase
VGLLPAAFAGIEVGELLHGAQAMRSRCLDVDPKNNPALASAMVHHLADTLGGNKVHVLMPYCDRLRDFADWYVQLWAESLGKAKTRDGQIGPVGPTPIPAVGTTDQHAQVQLFMEGPRDKIVTFVTLEDNDADLRFPDEIPEGYAYLKGHTLGRLLDAERKGTAWALAKDGRPSLEVRLDRLTPHALGELLFLYQAQTAFAGELYDVNAFDQPGVEAGKRIAFGLMGRDGYKEDVASVGSYAEPSTRLLLQSRGA